MHYNYRSGFLEHLSSITEIGIRIYPLYALEKDLVLMGLLLAQYWCNKSNKF